MIKEHNNIIEYTATIKQALEQLNNLQTKDSLTLFVVSSTKLVGTLTDGDIRRGLLQGKTIDDSVESVMQKKFKYLQRNNFSLEQIAELKAMEIKQLPIVNDVFEIEKIIDLSQKKSVLPIDAVIMAG